jgi:hypothetical protein
MGAACLYGSHMGGRWGHLGGVCALWKPSALDWSHMGARFHHLEGGWHHIRVIYAVMGATHAPNGAAGTVWESDGTMQEPHVTYEDYMRAVCFVWVLCAPYKRQLVPYESHMHCVGTMREPCAPCWSHVCHAGAMCAIEPCGSHMLPYGRRMAPYESCMTPKWDHMGLVCAVWEPHVPYGSQIEPHGRCMLPYRSSMHPMGPHEP